MWQENLDEETRAILHSVDVILTGMDASMANAKKVGITPENLMVIGHAAKMKAGAGMDLGPLFSGVDMMPVETK